MEIASPSPESIERAVSILRAGGTVAHATETCYGLACDLGNQRAVRTVFTLKERPEHIPVSALFESIEQAKMYVEWNELAEQLAHAHLPGPLTLVLPLLPGRRIFATPAGNDTLGIRISPHPVAIALVRAFGAPLSTTSANVHGQPNTYSSQEIENQFLHKTRKPDLLLDSGALKKVASSSVVNLVGGSIEVLRKGPIRPK
ncbi:threonylcarbamoyl-AMP synthase [Candidatus Peribacteria bacterium RIFOXYC2_FULL_55_14]|nr:MAG: hypothetical protein UY87_C0038G0004 [Candidatus Peribacteria bacterium GW2011_GWC2_54_8]KKW44613.1 MAG: hypothetical protein UY90_C0006G0002 [Candidatus Peregrinibacteria bacterium GW2011_GWA2_54_9]OGJ72464.1 MAG: threonylcarbamoyl-AMP synthase [Candidatus Peribacteria bacterium RIFOXYA1_FULL_56_14]OGJ73513.1 MAG: threonylcarbamoyl-AMP synthase [Candidatus Peribacteria bacterium RIFOXYA2_FULL_55_28]OGJ74694.1 MAG: threonylcarbamoyl-AMP synthase [Candidatus Peribacteria bacterium RIFOXY